MLHVGIFNMLLLLLHAKAAPSSIAVSNEMVGE